MPDIDINAIIWGIFVSATMKAAVYLGQDFQENLRTTKNTDFEKVKLLFDISQKLILNQNDEPFGISTITTEQSSCRKQKNTFILIRYFFLAKFMNIHDQQKPEKRNLSGSRNVLSIVNCKELTENQSSSSGKFSQDTSNLNSSKTESSSCRCRTTSIRQKSETKKFVFRTLYKKRRRQESFQMDSGHSWTRNRRKVVWNAHLQAKRFMEQFCGDDDASSQRKWTSYISSDTCVRPRIFEKQRKRNIIDPPQR